MRRLFLFLPLVLLLPVSCNHSSWNQGFQPKPVDNRNHDIVLKGNHHGYKDVDSVPVPLGPLKKPRYPAVLVSLEGEGNVYMAFVVDTRGLISETHVIYADDQKFADSVIEATKAWKFKPARKGGRDVSYVWLMPVKFHISDEPYPRTIIRDGL